MTDLNETITKQLLSQLKRYSPGWSWLQVVRQAKLQGESEDYARFLADEHCRMNGLQARPTPLPYAEAI